MSWRKTSNTRQGTSTIYSAADLGKIIDLLNGVDTSQPVTINNDWTFSRPPSGVTASTVADNSITDAKIAAHTSTKITITDKNHLPTDTVYTPAGVASLDLMKYSGSAWARQPKGAANQLLSMNSNATDIVWVNPATSQAPTNVLTVAGDGSGKYTKISDAIAAIPANTPTKISVAPGLYSLALADLISITAKSGVWIDGTGQGITIIQADSTCTTNTAIIQAYGAASGTAKSIPPGHDTAVGDRQITLSTTDSPSFVAGDWILVQSLKHPDTEFSNYCAGELQRVSAVNNVTGVLSLYDELNDAYTYADSATVIKIAMLTNISLSNFTLKSAAATSALTGGSMFFRFINGLDVEKVETDGVYWAGCQISSCVGFSVSNCNFHDTKDPNPATTNNTHYGLVVHAASQDGTADGNTFSVCRHSITLGGQQGTNYAGYVRNVTFTHNTSRSCDTADFDTHQMAEGIVFSSNTCIGGSPYTVPTGSTGAFGFQVRSKKTSLIGNKVFRKLGRAVYIFGRADDCLVEGNTIDGVKAYGGSGGYGIVLGGDGTTPVSGTQIIANMITNCDAAALTTEASAGVSYVDVLFQNNRVINCSTVSATGNLYTAYCNNWIVSNNRFKSTAGRPIQLITAGSKWSVKNNDFTGSANTAPSMVGTDHEVTGNIGYNRVGQITTPFVTSGNGDILNVAQASATGSSGAVHTNRWTPKTIIITGGSSVTISLNGVNTGETAGAFHLGIGDTITISWVTTAPTISVFAE